MHDRVRQVPLVGGLSDAAAQFLLGLFLQIVGKVTTVSNALSASFQAHVHLAKRLRGRVKTIHAAPGAFKVHYVELLIEEGVEVSGAVLETSCRCLEHLRVHVLNGISFS